MADTLDFFDRFKNRQVACIIDSTRSNDVRAALVSPAQSISPQIINSIASLTGGLFFVAISQARANALLLGPMTRPLHTPGIRPEQNDLPQMCISVEARSGVTTGISASDRSITIQILGDESPNPRKLVSPGHIFPVEAKDGGLLERTALPEAAVDVVTHLGYSDAALCVDLLDASGAFPTLDAIKAVCEDNAIPSITIQELTSYFLKTRSIIEKVSEARLPTEYAGEVKAITFKSRVHSGEHLVLVKGDISGDLPVLTRVHTESTLHDVFGGGTKKQREQILTALKQIGAEGRGVIVYLRKPSADLLAAEVSPHTSQPPRMDLMREYGIGAQILHHLGIKRIKILTGSKKNLVGLHAFGIEITEQLPL